jgi:DNA primase catalytic core
MVHAPIKPTALQRGQATTDALSRCLGDAINGLSAEQIYTHPAHNFKQSGDRIRGGCPFHQTKSGSSFVVTIFSKLFWCEGCQFGGSPADYRASLTAGRWVKARGKDFVEAVRELAVDANVSFPDRVSSPEEIAKAQRWERRRAVLATTQEYCQQVLWSDTEAALEARHYLVAERGLTEEEIKLLPIGYYPSADELKRHLISKGFTKEDWEGTGCVWKNLEQYITFLWNDANGRPLTIYGRYFRQHTPDGKPKTIASPGAKTKQSPLYFDRTLKAGHKEIVLVEGVLDAVLLQAKGDTRVCAYVAASCSGDQIETLRRHRIARVTLCGDPDAGGENGTNSNLLRLVETGISVYIAPKLPDGLDPDEFLLKYGMEGWKTHIDAAEHGFRWKARRLFESKDTSTDKGKAEVLQSAIAFCKTVKNHPELDICFWPVVRNNLGMEPEEFRLQLEKLWESSPVHVAEFGGGPGSGGRRGGSGGSGNGGDGGDGDDKRGKVLKHPALSPASAQEIEARLNALAQEGLIGSSLTGRLNQLAAETGRNILELRKQYQEHLIEIEQDELREDTAQQVDLLLEASTASVDLHSVLPSSLATPLLKLASWLNLKPECYLTTLLTTVSTLHKASTRVFLNKERDFDVSPNLYSAIIANSSQKKSPIIKAISKKPLSALQREAFEEYKTQMLIYEEDLREWEKLKPEDRGSAPEKPERKVYFFTKTNGEGLTYQAARCPEQGMLYLSDELAGMLNSQNQYRNGKGSDKQDLLTYYDGSADTVLRAEGVKSEAESILLGITGGIQPKVIQRLLDDCSDADGGWARFLFVDQPDAASEMWTDGGSYDLTELLADLYRKVDALPVTTYRLAPKAFKLFCKAYSRLEQLRVSERLDGMKSVWGKSEGRIGKLAVNLHVIHALMNGQTPSEEIPVEIVRAALKLTKFYAQQVQSLYTRFSDPDSLAPHLANVIQLAQRKNDWIKASDVYLSITKKHRPSGETVRQWFSELVLMGKGEIKGEGRNLQLRVFSDKYPPTPPPMSDPSSEKLDEIRQELDKSSNTESTIPQGTQELLDKLDDLDDFPKNENPTLEVEEQELDDNQDEVESSSGENQVLDELSKLSNNVQDVEIVSNTALDDLSNESSNLDDFSKTAPEQVDAVPQIGQLISVSEAADSDKQEKLAFAVGDRVLVKGVEGKIIAIDLEKWPENPYLVGTDDFAGRVSAEDLELLPLSVPEKPREAKVGDRIHYGEFTGTLAGKAQPGWHVSWNLCPSLLRRFPAPPAILKDGEFKLL